MNSQNLNEIIIKKLIKTVGRANLEKPIPLHEPNFKGTKSLDYLKECIDTGWVSSGGKWVNKFEEEICKYTKAKYAIAISNGTDALRLSLYIAGVRNGDEVLLPSISFVATANAISHLGGIPHFIDIDPSNIGMSPRVLQKTLENIAERKGNFIYNKQTGRKISAIVPVHIFGHPASIYPIKKIAENWALPLVEDSAEALGSWIKINEEYKHCGLIGDMGILSFNGNKILTTGGGGAIITNNKKLALKAKHLSTTAKLPHKWEFDHDQIGWNDRLPSINAALGLGQLEKIDQILSKKRKLAALYKKNFQNIDEVEILDEPTFCKSNFWLVTIRFNHKDPKIANKLKISLLTKAHEYGFLIRPSWKPLNKLKPFMNCPHSNLDISDDESNRLVNLPSSPHLI